MINFKFLKTQIKSSIWIAFGISIFLIGISILSMSFTPYFFDTEINTETYGTIGYDGAITDLELTRIFGASGEILALAFAVVLAIKLINIEISKGYMASWLNLPMTRVTFFTTKVLAILIASVITVLPNFLVQLIIAGHYHDFNLYAAGVLFKANFGLLLVFFLVSSITVTFSIIFNQTSHALTLSIVVPLFFILLSLLSSLANEINLQFLESLRYFTFFTFYDFKQLTQTNDKTFIWKFFLLITFSSSLFFFAGYWFNRKNLYI